MWSIATAVTHLSTALVVGAVLVAAGQPLATDDLWWHLALGETYANEGPWLDRDPLLFTATSAPNPSAWLSDIALHGVLASLGFSGLRVVHVTLVSIIFLLVWSLLRRVSDSTLLASSGLCVFAVLSAYRLFQLRPHLLTILCVLILFALLFAKPAVPSKRRIAVVMLLFMTWANLHSAFLLGPILLSAGVAGVLLGAVIGEPAQRPAEVARAKALFLTLVLGSAATLLNPSGWESHLAYFYAGQRSPELGMIGDEWAPFRPFSLPQSALPPSPLDWWLIWGLLIATPLLAAYLLLRKRNAGKELRSIDSAWIVMSLVVLPAIVVTVRFAWLAVITLLLMAAALKSRVARERSPAALAATLATAAIAIAFVPFGPWRSISGGVPRAPSQYLENDYAAAKWFSHGVWFLKDTGLQGNLFNDYFMGGYLGFWLAPEIRVFQNGTLNIPISTHTAMRSLRARRGLADGPSFATLLDDYDVDLVFGIGLPETQPRRWRHYSTALMERVPGWLLVFRDVRSSIYLRDDPANRENLERVVAYYAVQGVPFDRRTGFDPRRAVREARAWATQHGLLPVHLSDLLAQSRDQDPSTVAVASGELALLYAALGLYEDALLLDDRVLELFPEAQLVKRRRLWSLLRLNRASEASAAAEEILKDEASGPLLRSIARQALLYVSLDAPEDAASLTALSTFMSPTEARRLRSALARPEQREP